MWERGGCGCLLLAAFAGLLLVALCILGVRQQQPALQLELRPSTRPGVVDTEDGCPPLPALCRLQDVFDEVIVLAPAHSPPQRAQRTAAQLAALGTPFTLVQARNDSSAGEALLAVLRRVAAGPARHCALLADGVTLAADFPAAFDAAARALPAGWAGAWLGWAALQLGDVPAPQRAGALWAAPAAPPAQACALGLTREAAAAALQQLLLPRSLQQGAAEGALGRALLQAFPGRAWAAHPPVAAADPYTPEGPTQGWPQPGADFARASALSRQRFDLWGRGFSREALAPPHACPEAEVGFDYFQGDVASGSGSGGSGGETGGGAPLAPEPALPAATPSDCCSACLRDWPRCRFWTHHPSAGGQCYLKRSRQGRRPAAGFVSGGAGSEGWAPAPSASPSASRSPSPAPSPPPLRRHALLLTGAIRDLVRCLPGTLRLFRATPGGLDIYAVLSPSASGWHDGSGAYSAASDGEAVAWLRRLPEREAGVSLQALRVEEALREGEGGSVALSAQAQALFPRMHAYPRDSDNPFLNVLRDSFKMNAAWEAMAARCAEARGGSNSSSSSSSSSSSNSSSSDAEEGGGCYATVVRARPDICMSAEDNEAALPGGVDLDAWARSGAQLAPPGAVASRVLYTPQLDPARAACSSDGAAAAAGGGNASAAAATVHEIFGSDFANCWGGPSDYFLFGRTSAMALVMLKARVFDALIVDRGVRCHPETLTRCAAQELARERTLRGVGGAVHLVAHTALKLGFCRRWAQQTLCTGRRDCVSVDGAAAFWGPAGAAPAACEPIIFTPL